MNKRLLSAALLLFFLLAGCTTAENTPATEPVPVTRPTEVTIPATEPEPTISQVSIGGTVYSLSIDSLTVTDPDMEELEAALPLLTQLKTVTLNGTLPELSHLAELKSAFPEITFLWNFEVYGVPVTTATTELDLSGIPLTDTEALEAALPCFYDLQKVDMCGCGLSDEAMDALNRKYPQTIFVWEVKLRGIWLRTDATSFMPQKEGYHLDTEDCEVLKYCRELRILDLGHMQITDCSFLYGTPKLEVLILADTPIQDISPVGSLAELRFLEIFLTKTNDYAPLLGCTALEDLNISFTFFPDFEPLYQMTWLDRLWLASDPFTYEDQLRLRDALPETVIVFRSNASTDRGWRFGPKYFNMRDIFGMPYSYT